MKITRVHIPSFRALGNIELSFEPDLSPQVFPLGSQNGGGKSTLLQTIFTLLYCFRDKERYQYIQNLLEGSQFALEFSNGCLFSTIEVLSGDEKIELEFSIRKSVECDSTNEDGLQSEVDFSEMEQSSKIGEELEEFKALKSRIAQARKELLRVSKARSSKNDKTEAMSFVFSLFSDVFLLPREKTEIQKLRNKFRRGYRETLELREFVETIGGRCQRQYDELKARRLANQENLAILNNWLEDQNSEYICSFIDGSSSDEQGSSLSLIYSVRANDELDVEPTLDLIPEKVYLAAPSTHMFLFLDGSSRRNVFKTTSSGGGLAEYYSNLEHLKQKCSSLFTYDFFATELLIGVFQKARDRDFRHAVEFGEYGENYKRVIDEINKLLGNKVIRVSPDLSGVFFESFIEGESVELLPEDLSHGELKRLSIYMWLKHHVSSDSVVLMDEVEIALHPDWQYQVTTDLDEWGPSNQYILATHSYELCEALTPAHVKELEPRLKKQTKSAAA